MLASNTELVRPFPSGSFNVEIRTSMTSWQGGLEIVLGLLKVRKACPCSRFTESQKMNNTSCHSFGVAEAWLIALQKRPPGDMEYCHRSHGRSPKETRWEFEDDKV